jgi:molecular chaperone DnaJ
MDPYAVLGLDAGATQDEIRRAYRTLARKHHPDLNQHRQGEAEQAIKRLNAAYDILRDEKRRAAYDLERRRAAFAAANPAGRGRGGTAPGSDFDGAAWRAQRDAEGSYFKRWSDRRRDFFRDEPPPPVPGSGAKRDVHTSRNPRNGADRAMEEHELHEIRLTFKQAVRGVTKSIVAGANTPCGMCNGTGRVDSEAPPRCESCRRQGLRTHSLTSGRFVHVCKFCGWSEEGTVRCPGCAGTGRSKGHRVRVAIPPGLHDGARLRHRVVGMARPVHIVVHVGGSRQFERGTGDQADHLLTTVTVPRDVAALGGQAKVPTVEGSVTVRVPPGLADGACMKLSNRGVKRRDGSYGDLIVRFRLASGKSRSGGSDPFDGSE